ncbi:hypothetical protein CFN78_09970 [Amycolatopsis antarctica]|uniref:Uncharacterized protein n=1 Tax=Amycolatopsis antarctica TaxID=1854586 RepID=A0A263D405_9PSEU|nr:hypothetical protein [Amycolatopsis antarctica]OZM73193.1 hypothetical protein CFN78_09970 [Amycolatopsis antarctica]
MVQPVQVDVLSPDRRKPVVAAVTGFAVGALVLGLLWGLSAVTPGAATDARAACAALERVGTLPDSSGNTLARAASLTPGTLERLAAARALAAAAAETGDSYDKLAQHIDGVNSMVVSLNFGDIGGRWHLREANRLCGQV